MTEQEEELRNLARQVLTLSRNTLLVNLRFLDVALSRLEPLELPELTYATDGHYLAYDPRHMLRRYKIDKAIPVRDYLHIVLHCVFCHMFVHPAIDRDLWNLSCYIAVEAAITGLGIRAASTQRESDQNKEFIELKKTAGVLTAEKLYRYFLESKLNSAKMADLRGLFYTDDHRLWYMTDGEKKAETDYRNSGNGNSGGNRCDTGHDDEDITGNENEGGTGDGRESNTGESNKGETDGDGEGKHGDGEVSKTGSDDENGSSGICESMGGRDAKDGTTALWSEEDWRSVSERIKMDVETFSSGQGWNSGAMIQKNPLLHSVEILAMISASYGGGADGDAERYNRT